MPDAGKAKLVDNESRMMAFQSFEGVSIVGVDDESALVEFLMMLVQLGKNLRQAHVLRPGMNPLQIPVPDQVLLQLGSSLHANLGVVLRNELFLVLKFDPGFTLEQSHY